MISLGAETDGKFLICLKNTPYISDEEIVLKGLKSYIVKNSDEPFLKILTLPNITLEIAKVACEKDGRNFRYIPTEYQSIPRLAYFGVKADKSVYDTLPQNLKDDASVKEALLW